ncbi:hypothetical protein ES703_98115 [subsurface metagenome]
MSTRLEDKSIPELLDISSDVIRNYRIMFDKILGSTPEEAIETQEALEGLTPAYIREAVKRFKSGTPAEISVTHESLEGLTPDEIMNAVRLNRYFKPAKLEELLELLKDFNPIEIKQVMEQYRKKHPK